MEIRDFPRKTTRDSTDTLLIQEAGGATLHIEAGDFLEGIGGGSPPTEGQMLNFSAPLDPNGVVWFFGTNGLTQPWANPQTFNSGLILASPGSALGHPLNWITSRSFSAYHTLNAPHQWIRFDFGAKKLKPSVLLQQNRMDTSNTTAPRIWEGSNDLTTWVIVGYYDNLPDQSYWNILEVHSQLFFRYIRVRQPAGMHLIVGNIDMYGELI